MGRPALADRALERHRERLRDHLPDDRVVAVERARWGFATPTRILTLASGRRTVIQLVTSAAAARAPEAARVLREAGLPVPGFVARLPRGGAACLVWEFVAGTIGASLLDGDHAATLAGDMGRAQRAMQAIDSADVPVEEAWRGPRELRAAARRWLAEIGWTDSAPARAPALTTILDRVVDRAWTLTTTHGDYVPANVLVADGRMTAILDLGDVALRHPLVDGAWWSLIVAFHHPAEHPRLETAYLAGAGLPTTSIQRRQLADVAAVRALQLAAAPARGSIQRLLLAAAIERAARPV